MPDFENLNEEERVQEISLEELNQLAGGPETGEVIHTTAEELKKRIINIRVPRENFPNGEIPKETEIFVKPPEKNWQKLGKMPYAQELAKFKVSLQGEWQVAFRYWLICICGKKVVIVPGPFSPVAKFLIKCFIIKPNLKPLIECFTEDGNGCGCKKEENVTLAG